MSFLFFSCIFSLTKQNFTESCHNYQPSWTIPDQNESNSSVQSSFSIKICRSQQRERCFRLGFRFVWGFNYQMLGEFTQRIGCLKCEIGVYSNDAFGCVEEKKRKKREKQKLLQSINGETLIRSWLHCKWGVGVRKFYAT